MMNGLFLPFIAMPCAGAVVAAWLLTDWRLAAAATSGALALLFLATSVQLPFLGVALPVISGVAVGALTTCAMLLLQPDGSLWTRLSVALGASFVIFFGYLSIVLGGAT